MARAKQPVSVNGVEFDALMDETRGFEATVPEYAVEKGFNVSDAIILGSETLNMTLFLTNTPVTWHRRHGSDQNRVESVVKQLQELYYDKKPVTVVTSDATFTSMAITSLTISKSLETGYAREIPISFKKIRVTQAATTTIPASYGKSGASGTQAGTANTSAGSSGGSGGGSGGGSDSKGNSSKGESKSSILYGAAKGVGLV